MAERFGHLGWCSGGVEADHFFGLCIKKLSVIFLGITNCQRIKASLLLLLGMLLNVAK